MIGIFALLMSSMVITTGCESLDAITVLQGISDGLEASQENLYIEVYD